MSAPLAPRAPAVTSLNSSPPAAPPAPSGHPAASQSGQAAHGTNPTPFQTIPRAAPRPDPRTEAQGLTLPAIHTPYAQGEGQPRAAAGSF